MQVQERSSSLSAQELLKEFAGVQRQVQVVVVSISTKLGDILSLREGVHVGTEHMQRQDDFVRDWQAVQQEFGVTLQAANAYVANIETADPVRIAALTHHWRAIQHGTSEVLSACASHVDEHHAVMDRIGMLQTSIERLVDERADLDDIRNGVVRAESKGQARKRVARRGEVETRLQQKQDEHSAKQEQWRSVRSADLYEITLDDSDRTIGSALEHLRALLRSADPASIDTREAQALLSQLERNGVQGHSSTSVETKKNARALYEKAVHELREYFLRFLRNFGFEEQASMNEVVDWAVEKAFHEGISLQHFKASILTAIKYRREDNLVSGFRRSMKNMLDEEVVDDYGAQKHACGVLMREFHASMERQKIRQEKLPNKVILNHGRKHVRRFFVEHKDVVWQEARYEQLFKLVRNYNRQLSWYHPVQALRAWIKGEKFDSLPR